MFVGHAQEIDLNTGKVLFDWRSLDHVPLSESFQDPPANPKGTFDYFHINSVAEMDDGNLLISGRNTWTLYKVDRSSGNIIWRLNGKRSNFSVSAAAQFYWQHHARQNGTSGLTVFDNAGPNKERQSRGLSLTVDTSAMRVDLAQAYIHPARFLSNTLGSVQVLGDGRVFIGWGDQPYFSEFAAGRHAVAQRPAPGRRPLVSCVRSRLGWAAGRSVRGSWPRPIPRAASSSGRAGTGRPRSTVGLFSQVPTKRR